MSLPLIIDSDLALDDWMALIFLLQSPEVDVRAITVAATGEAHAGPGVKNTLRLMALAGAPDIPVASGRKVPLEGTHRFPLALRLAMDFRLGLSLPRPRTRPSKEPAVALLRRTLLEAPAPSTLLALGPLTNLAELIGDSPELVSRIEHLWIMGGALDVPGNIAEINPRIDNPHAEWNLYIDPTAAERVLQSGVPVTVVPLDATSQVPLTEAFLARLDAEGQSPASRFVSRVIHRIRPLLSKERNLCFWDPLAAVLTLRHELGRYEERRVRVLTAEGRESGRLVTAPDGHLVRVCTGVDIPAFERCFLEGLEGRLTPRDAVRARG